MVRPELRNTPSLSNAYLREKNYSLAKLKLRAWSRSGNQPGLPTASNSRKNPLPKRIGLDQEHGAAARRP